MSMEKTVSAGSYTASAALVGLGITLNEFAIIVGILTGVGTFALNWYYQRKRTRIMREKLGELGKLYADKD